jgi:hypothetical protein
MPTYIAYARYSTNTTPITLSLHYHASGNTGPTEAPWLAPHFDSLADADLNVVDLTTIPPTVDEDLDFHPHGEWLVYNSMGTLLGGATITYGRNILGSEEWKSRIGEHPAGAAWAEWARRFGTTADGVIFDGTDYCRPPHPRLRRWWRGEHGKDR